jgi:nucleoside-triphosphatase THEP1
MIQVFILSGPVHSGKTTRLTDWLINKKAAGILAPVINGKIHLVELVTKKKKQLELEENLDSTDVTCIGRYVFKNSVFNWACKILIDSADKNYEWLVIDEFGPLEMKGQGLAPAISSLFSNEINLHETKILFVVREALVKDFLNHLKIDDAAVHKINLLD